MNGRNVGAAPGHVFISYVHEDRDQVDRLQRGLEIAGIKVWRDTADLWPGQDWKQEIRQAITTDSLAFIACFSEHSEIKGKSFQNEELALAAEQMRLRPPGRAWLIPVRFAECRLPEFDLGAGRTLDSLQRVDLFDGSWEYAMPRLTGAVLRILEGPPFPGADAGRRHVTPVVYPAAKSATSATSRARPPSQESETSSPTPADARMSPATGVFLSYAEEDKNIADEVSAWLRREGFDIYDWRDSTRRGGRFIQETETAIQRADSFLVLLSPSYLASPWCRLERELALQRELDLQADGRSIVFIHVLKVASGSYLDGEFLRSYDWIELDSVRSNEALSRLAATLGPTSRAISASALRYSTDSAFFRDRRDELDQVMRGLTSADGPHFWLVLAPPQLGKTWFLDRVAAELTSSSSSRWQARLVDFVEQPADTRSNAAAILGAVFGAQPAAGPSDVVRIAEAICRAKVSHLCLLDSAELLDEQTAYALHTQLTQIYRLVQDAGLQDVRLALIVASRREDQWHGTNLGLRPAQLPLAELQSDTIQQAVYDLAYEMGRAFDPATLNRCANHVQHLSEGIPALFARCLEWIRAHEWVGMDRLASQQLFADLAHSFIQDKLLSRDILTPPGQSWDSELRRVLLHGLRLLAPYRFVTPSHLRHSIDSDPSLEARLMAMSWSIEEFWIAITGTALMLRSQNGFWPTIYPPIRRLLFRYYYETDEAQADAHRNARIFVEAWASRRAGQEQVAGLVECLWHETAALRLIRSARIREDLSETARTLSLALSPSSMASELRGLAAERIRDDKELQQATGNLPGLLSALTDIVAEPSSSPG